MNPIFKRKLRQFMQRTTDEKFWDTMNFIHNQAYQLGRKHAREAIECHPKISKRMAEEVDAKADEIRETWDGLHEVSVDLTDISTLEKH
ncbi:hypothetical protein GCM10023310_00750 [Paenibacillus vulneris]|uniref:Uncharacterized protein n=1 Tax=Paenibacillus vulneris TaxID=1133364 RepID=A0ABW3UXE8_9BACL